MTRRRVADVAVGLVVVLFHLIAAVPFLVALGVLG